MTWIEMLVDVGLVLAGAAIYTAARWTWAWWRTRGLVNPVVLDPEVRERCRTAAGTLQVTVLPGRPDPDAIAADYLIDATRHYPVEDE